MIDYQATLIEGRLISRYKRFFADIDTGDGVITAHCANTGRMTGLIEEGSRVWFRKQPSGRKLGFAWELVEVSSDMACINTMRANELLSSTDLSFLIPGVSFFRREPKVGSHRLDLELSREGHPCMSRLNRSRSAKTRAWDYFRTRHLSALRSMSVCFQKWPRVDSKPIWFLSQCIRAFSRLHRIDCLIRGFPKRVSRRTMRGLPFMRWEQKSLRIIFGLTERFPWSLIKRFRVRPPGIRYQYDIQRLQIARFLGAHMLWFEPLSPLIRER